MKGGNGQKKRGRVGCGAPPHPRAPIGDEEEENRTQVLLWIICSILSSELTTFCPTVSIRAHILWLSAEGAVERVGSCAADAAEPGQVREEAAIRRIVRVPQGCLALSTAPSLFLLVLGRVTGLVFYPLYSLLLD